MVLFPHFLVRHILASLHFNENVQRETQVGKDGDNYYKVSYPKFKLGEEVVRDVASPPTYGKYLMILMTLMTLSGHGKLCITTLSTTILLSGK